MNIIISNLADGQILADMKKGFASLVIFLIFTFCFGEDEAQFILLPENKTTIVGSDVMFKCKAVYQNGSSLPVTWSKDGNEDLPSRYLVGAGFLLVSSVRLSDGGQYSCLARPASKTHSIHAHLNVLSTGKAPHFTKAFSPSYTIMPSDTAVIFCSAFGIPIPTIRWRRDGSDVSSDPNNSGPYAIDGALYFKNAESVHSGSYQCVAENVLGLVSQATIVNIVQQAIPIWKTWWMMSLYCIVFLVLLLMAVCILRTCYSRYRNPKTDVQGLNERVDSVGVVSNSAPPAWICETSKAADNVTLHSDPTSATPESPNGSIKELYLGISPHRSVVTPIAANEVVTSTPVDGMKNNPLFGIEVVTSSSFYRPISWCEYWKQEEEKQQAKKKGKLKRYPESEVNNQKKHLTTEHILKESAKSPSRKNKPKKRESKGLGKNRNSANFSFGSDVDMKLQVVEVENEVVEVVEDATAENGASPEGDSDDVTTTNQLFDPKLSREEQDTDKAFAFLDEYDIASDVIEHKPAHQHA